MRVYDLPEPTVNAAFAAAAADGFEQAAVIAADAPDVPGLVLGKLLRPLTTRPVAVAPAEREAGLLGVASRLPAPDWLPTDRPRRRRSGDRRARRLRGPTTWPLRPPGDGCGALRTWLRSTRR